MKLELMDSFVPVKTERNGEFFSLGMVSHATSEGLLVFLEDQRFLSSLLQNTHVSCVITTNELAENVPVSYGIAVSDNPRRDFFEFHNYLATKTDFYWKDFPSEISEEAIIHPKAYIADKNVRVGRGTVIEPGVTILERTIIGEDVILRAGCTLGSQGFEFKRIDGKILNVAHAGGLKIGNRVEIQSNSALSRSIFGGFTELGEDTKLDNLVHIAHNVTIGKRCFLAACAMIAGSVTIGNDVWIGPGVSISSEITIGDDAEITIGSVVTRDVLSNHRVTGNFAIDHQKFLSFLKSIR
jgi:UDP-3-O-[3-hydroxymyristoyl] glucosamine N-acyltransferase